MQYLRDNAGVLEASADGTTWQAVTLGGGSGNGGGGDAPVSIDVIGSVTITNLLNYQRFFNVQGAANITLPDSQAEGSLLTFYATGAGGMQINKPTNGFLFFTGMVDAIQNTSAAAGDGIQFVSKGNAWIALARVGTWAVV